MRRRIPLSLLALGLTVAAHADVPTLIEGDVRVQALSPTLVRIELKGAKGFEDRPTFRVLQRDWPGVAGAAMGTGGGDRRLSTPIWDAVVPAGAKSVRDVRIVGKDGTLLFSSTGAETHNPWLPAPGAVGKTWAFSDNPRVIPAPQGATPSATDIPMSGWDLGNDAPDLYVFLPDRSYTTLRRDFLRLTGPSEMPPLFMLGLIDSKYHPYTEAEALDRVDQYHKRSIPLDVLTIDTDWRLNGSHGYTSDPRYFPDMQGFITKAKAKGVRLMYNDHPEPQAPGAFDPKEMNYRWGGLTKLMGEGMDVWWYDRNWGVSLHEPVPGIHSHLWGMRVYHDMTERFRPNERPVIMGNVEGIDNGIRNYAPDVSAHRFSVQWTGDTSATWPFLRRAVENAVQGGVEALNPWINDDLGGHNGGQPSPELYIRFMQYGSLAPVMRPHCTRDLERAPWAFGAEAERIVGDYVRMRYRLMPLLYASARESYDTGEPVVRRLDLDYPTFKEAQRDDQYLLGRSLLVAPIVEDGSKPLSAEWAKTPWRAEYWANEDLKGASVLSRDEATPGFELTRAAVAPGVPVDHFSARWTGSITNSGPEAMRLFALSDDGLRVWIDGKLVLDRWGPQDSSSFDIPGALAPGSTHSVRIEYQELDGGQRMRLGVAPVEPRSERPVWVPPGTWTNLWTGERVTGPKSVTVAAKRAQMPMFAKAGAVVPNLPEIGINTVAPWKTVALDVFPGQSGEATLYEDDGHSVGYRKSAFRRTAIAMRESAGSTAVTISPATGTYPGALPARAWTLRLHVAPGTKPTGATIDGKRAEWKLVRRDAKAPTPFGPSRAIDGDVVEVRVPATSVTRPVEVVVATR